MKLAALLLMSILPFSSFAEEYILRAGTLPASFNSTVKKTYSRAKIVTADLTPAQAAILKSQGVQIELNRKVHLLAAPANWAMDAIHAPQAHALPNGNGEGVTVCVVDTGADSTHPSLQASVAGGINFSTEGAQDDFSDKVGHGTAVAGLVAGAEGVAPAAKLYIAKFLDSTGSGTIAAGAEAILSCLDKAQVLNLSFGSFEDSQIIKDAIDQALAKGLTVVAAAGNDAEEINFPARYAPVIAVSAVNEHLDRATFASYGPELDFVAPGVNIDVIQPGKANQQMSGTSFSAAIVSGVEAIRRSRGAPALKARDLGMTQELQGEGLIDAELSAALIVSPSHKLGCFPRSPDAAFVLNAAEKVSDSQRDNLFRSLRSIYAQDVAARGESLNLYETNTMDFGAFASQGVSVAEIEINKGTRYHKFMTPDSYALIVCHEFGHHLGGQPLASRGDWATVEGGADYFGNLKCMRRYFESLPSGELFAQPAPALDLVAKCQARFSRANEVQICARSLAATRQLGMVLTDLGGQGQQAFPSLDKSDSTVVQTSLESHPQAQCRVDTYRAAALCTVPWSEALSNDDITAGACHTQRNPADGRPACWFAAPSTQISISANGAGM